MIEAREGGQMLAYCLHLSRATFVCEEDAEMHVHTHGLWPYA